MGKFGGIGEWVGFLGWARGLAFGWMVFLDGRMV